MASPIPQKDDVERWTVEQVAAWLRQMELTDCCEFFLRRGIDGHNLMELTEEDLILWGREVSIRNRKKILKLTKQIETHHLSSSGKQQPSQYLEPSRPPLGSPLTPPASSDQEVENFESDGDSFSSDEFDDSGETELKNSSHSQFHIGNGTSSLDSLNEGTYLTSISESGTSFIPNSSKPQLPNKPICTTRKPCVAPDKRPQMPLPPTVGNQAPLLPPRPGQKSNPPPVISKRGLTPSPNSNGTKPTGNASLKHSSKDWPVKKASEPSVIQNSQSDSCTEGRTIHRFVSSPLAEDTDNDYEVVGCPAGTCMENEIHTATPCGFPSSQEPPPLPKRNQDGRDVNFTGSTTSSISAPSRVNSSSSAHPTRAPLLVNNGQVRKQPIHLKPLKSAQSSSSHTSSVKPLPQFSQPVPTSVPLEKAPKPPVSSSELPDSKRSQYLPYSAERINIGDGESVELSPLYRTLIDRPYFHVISRSKSKKLLESAADGVFLIRPSTRSSDPLTLCLQYKGRTYNINIRRRNDAHYALGTEKVNEMTFKSVDELVSTYSREPIKLQSGDRIRLTSSPTKEDHIYVRMPIPVQKKF